MYSHSRRGRGGGRGGGGGNFGRQKDSLGVGMQGFICSCNFNERDCVKEAYSILNEYFEKTDLPQIGGQEEPAPTATEAVVPDPSETPAEAEASANDAEIDSVIAAETKERNDPGRRFRFQSILSGAKNIVFIKTTVPDPSALVHTILSDVFETKQQKTKFLIRMLPIDATCNIHIADIRSTSASVLSKYFTPGVVQTYQVAYKCRYNDKLSRDEVIECVAEVASEVNPLSKVDLTNPDLVIIVEIIRHIVCLGVARDFNKFKKYNLIEAGGEIKGPGEGIDDGTKKVESEPGSETVEDEESKNQMTGSSEVPE